MMSVGAPATGLSLVLTYNVDMADGTNSIVDTTLPRGWTHSYNGYLLQRGNDFIWIRGDSEVVTFTRRGGVFTHSTGQFYDLTVTDGTPKVRLRDGTVYEFQQEDVPWQPLGAAFLLESILDPNGRATQLTYNNGLLTHVTDPFGNALHFDYNPDSMLSAVTASGRQGTFEYDTGHLSAMVLADGTRVEYTYNFLAQITEKTIIGNRNGSRTYYVDYDQGSKACCLRDSAGTTVASQNSNTEWEPDYEESVATGEMHYLPGTATVIDGRGNEWHHTYDSRGNMIETLNPRGHFKTIEYDPATLLPERIIDENGHETYYEYDERGNRTLLRDAEGNETTYEYELISGEYDRLVRRIEPDEDVWEYVYDENGNLIEAIDPLIEQPEDATVTYEYYTGAPYQGLLWRKTDRNGNVTEWEYYPDGNVKKEIDPGGCETEYTYDAFGNVLSRTVHNDTGDQTTSYTYNARDRVDTVTDPVGNTTKYEYDSVGNRIAVYTCWIDESTYRSVTRYEYDSRDRLVRTIEDDGGLDRITEYDYDNNDNRIEEIDPNGVVTQFEYDELNRVVRTLRDPGGLEIEREYGYDPVGNKITEIDPNDHTATYDYDVLNRLTWITDPLGNETEYRYFPPGGGGCGGCGTPGSSNIHCVIDAEDKVTKYEYDQLDRRTREIRQIGVQDCDAPEDGDDAVTEYTYDPNGNLLSTTDPNGNTTTLTYTVRGEVESVSNGCDETTTYTYDCAGNHITEEPPNGNIIHYEYDLNNRLEHVYDTIGDLVDYTYDCVGNRITEADAVGPATTYEYDNLDRVAMVTDPMAEETEYEYDAVGNLTKIIDREDNETVYEYDNASRRTVSRIWPQNGGDPAETSYEYDDAGNLLSITDGNGNTTAYTYDVANRQITQTFADETEQRYTYDGVGNPLTYEDNMGEGDIPGTGNVTTYTYDDLHRRIRSEYEDGSADVFAYDKGGRMLSADNDHSHVGFTYDCADRVLTSTQTDLPQTYSYAVTYIYDVAANTRTIHYPSGKVVVETRDLRDRLSDVTDAASYTYDLANRVLTRTFDNGTEARHSYNDNDWITELRHVATDGTTTFAGFAHDYDREGNRLNAQNLQEVVAYDDARPATHSEVYAYDDIHRLIDYKRGQWVSGDVPAPRRLRTWQIDNVHNWEEFGIHDLDTGEDETYCNSINQMNEYDDWSTDGQPPVPDDDGLPDDFMVSPCPSSPLGAGGHRPALRPEASETLISPDFERGAPTAEDNGGRDTGFNRAHDKNGNLVDDDVNEYYYDYQTTMGSVLRAQNRLTMVKRKSDSAVLGEYWYDALGRRIRKLADGLSTVYVYTRDWRAIEEYEDGALARSYAYGGWIDEVLAMDRAAEADRLYYHANALGSIIAVTDGGGDVVERYTYDAYGAPLIESYAQPPDQDEAYGSDLTPLPPPSDAVQILADDFSLAETTLITGLRWWGAYAYGDVPDTDDFTLRFYDEADFFPGSLVWEEHVGDQVSRLPTGRIITTVAGDLAEYVYEMKFATPFWAGAGTWYWVSVVNNTVAQPLTWGWETAGEGNVYAAYSLDGGPWQSFGEDLTFQFLTDRSAVGNPYLFTARRYDAETGWYHYRARYLDSVTGRFAVRDPMGPWGDPTNLGNTYTYVGSNPWSSIDPSGRETRTIKGTIIEGNTIREVEFNNNNNLGGRMEYEVTFDLTCVGTKAKYTGPPNVKYNLKSRWDNINLSYKTMGAQVVDYVRVTRVDVTRRDCPKGWTGEILVVSVTITWYHKGWVGVSIFRLGGKEQKKGEHQKTVTIDCCKKNDCDDGADTEPEPDDSGRRPAGVPSGFEPQDNPPPLRRILTDPWIDGCNPPPIRVGPRYSGMMYPVPECYLDQ
ncbi:MAG: RHS repeat-associated core domain-containing protein [Phycisphaerae bacterium]